MSEPHILFLTQWWPHRLESAGVVVGTAAALRTLGPVCVVSGIPLDLRTNRVADGGSWVRHEVGRSGPFPVIRHSFFPGHGPSALKRMAMYASFALSSLRSVPSLWKDADVCVVYASPMTATTAAFAGTWLRGVPYVCIVQDVWPDAILASGIMEPGIAGSLAHNSMKAMTNRYYRDAASIVVISDGMKDLLVQRAVPAEKIHVVFNWNDEDLYEQPVSVPSRGPKEPLRLMYAGNFGGPQGLDVLLRALAMLPSDRFHLTMIGGGAEEQALRSLAKELRLANVEFVGPKPKQSMPGELALAHVHVVSLCDDPVFSVTIPSKLQSLMLAGVPIIAAVPGEAGAIIKEAAAGWVCGPDDPYDLADVLRKVELLDHQALEDRGRAGRAYYQREMSRRVGEERLLLAVKAALRSSRRASRD